MEIKEVWSSSHPEPRDIPLSRRVLTSERSQLCCLESLAHASSRGVKAQTGGSQRSKAVKNIEGVDCELLLVASHPSLPATVHTSRNASSGVELLLGEHGVFLAVVANQEYRWKSVRELKNTGCADEGC